MTLFSRIVVVGVGMLGGSIGTASRRQRLTDCIVGIDPRRDHLDTALACGRIDCATTDLDDGIRHFGPLSTSLDRPKPELIVLAAPVDAIADTARRIIGIIRDSGQKRNVLLTDVGSTKESICSRLAPFSSGAYPVGCRFIGSHPIAGSERSGPENAVEDLFVDRLAVVTPSEGVRDLDLALLVRFWQGLGSLVTSMTPEEHDRVLARTSHLPHLLSSLLADRLRRQDARYTGSGFRSTTRLASGFPPLWSGIVSSNADAILDTIRDYEKALGELREKIERKDWPGIAAFLESAKRNRDALQELTIEN